MIPTVPTIPSPGLTSATAAFNPSSVGTVTAWFDASRITGLSGGDPVSQWSDLSGAGKHMTQATGSLQPSYQTNVINGLPVVRFVDDVIAMASAVTVGHAFVVAKYSAATFANYAGLLNGVANIPDHVILLGQTGGGQFYDDTTTTVYHKNGTAFAENAMAGPMNVFAIMSISGAFGSHTLNMGFHRDLADRPWVGDVAEVIVFDAALSAGNRTTIQAYLGDKYGIAVV